MPFVCEYLELLKPLRHLIVDFSREKHIKVQILFVTIETGTFRLSAIISTNLFSSRMHSFPVPLFAAKNREVKNPICNTRLV